MKYLLTLSLLALSACSSGMIHVDAINGLVGPITARHDGYVQNDPALSEELKSDYLRSSAILRAVLEEAKED